MSERPILFSAPMVRAILAGTKTQTRRIVTVPRGSRGATDVPQPRGDFWTPVLLHPDGLQWRAELDPSSTWPQKPVPCPYGQPGDQLWGREAWSLTNPISHGTLYRADFDTPTVGPWKPSIHMPRAVSRIQLEVTGVRVERLQAISEADARAEGVTVITAGGLGPELFLAPGSRGEPDYWTSTAKLAYAELWESINGAGSWDANPWVWVVEFRKLRP